MALSRAQKSGRPPPPACSRPARRSNKCNSPNIQRLINSSREGTWRHGRLMQYIARICCLVEHFRPRVGVPVTASLGAALRHKPFHLTRSSLIFISPAASRLPSFPCIIHPCIPRGPRPFASRQSPRSANPPFPPVTRPPPRPSLPCPHTRIPSTSTLPLVSLILPPLPSPSPRHKTVPPPPFPLSSTSHTARRSIIPAYIPS